MQSVTSEIRAEFQRYGQTNNTRPNFVWPQFVQYNALSKARALGSTNDLFVTLTGTIGAQGGTQTLFFALHLPEPGFLRIRLNSLNRYEDKYLYVGLSDSNAHTIQLDEEGYATRDQSNRNLSDEDRKLFQPGVYYFSVGSSQWASLPFSVSIEAFKMIAPSELPVATTEQPGIVQLSTSLHSPATNRAATASTVKTVYDYAENAFNTSQQAIDSADYARGLATEAQSTAQQALKEAEEALKKVNNLINSLPSSGS